jgi:peptidoglycan/LPS O-acetylase OafA/YrhL
LLPFLKMGGSQDTTAKSTYLTALDSLRAFAALSVCFYHFVYTTTGFIHTGWVRDLFYEGKAGVQTFFVISGFVIPWSMHQAGFKFRNVGSFLLKRITRLEPPYLFSIVLALTIYFLREKLLGRSNDHMQVTGLQILLHIGYLIPWFEGFTWLNQVYWTLCVEFQYYLFIGLLFLPLLNGTKFLRWILLLSILAISQIGTSEFLLFWLPVFLIGIGLFLYKTAKFTKMEFGLLNVVLLVICFMKYGWACTLFSFLPVLVLLLWPHLKVKGLHQIGQFSYSLYLIHPLLGASFINVFSHHCNTPLQKLAVLVSGIILTLVGAWVMYRFIEKPSKKLSSSIRYKSH